MSAFRRLVPAVYAFGLMILLFVAVDLAVRMWPPDLGDAGWRFGTMGYLSNSMVMPVFGLGVLLVAATASGHTWLQRGIGVLSFVGALALAGGGVVFILDFFQLRAELQPTAGDPLGRGAVRALINLGVAVTVLAVLGVGAWKAAGETRSMPRVAPKAEGARIPGRVVVGPTRGTEAPAAPTAPATGP